MVIVQQSEAVHIGIKCLSSVRTGIIIVCKKKERKKVNNLLNLPFRVLRLQIAQQRRLILIEQRSVFHLCLSLFKVIRDILIAIAATSEKKSNIFDSELYDTSKGCTVIEFDYYSSHRMLGAGNHNLFIFIVSPKPQHQNSGEFSLVNNTPTS